MNVGLKVLGAGAVALLLASVALDVRAENHEERRQLDSHVHGVTRMNIAVEGNSLAIEVESPAANIVGFEHRPNNEKQERAIADALSLLEAGDVAFVLPDAAGCQLTEANVQTSYDDEEGDGEHREGEAHSEDEHDDEDHHEGEEAHSDGDEHHGEEAHADGDEHHDEETHSEFAAEYLFACSAPDQLVEMDVKLFEQFSGIEEIEVQLVSESGQTAVELTPEQSRLSF